jgi:hypothetical protein
VISLLSALDRRYLDEAGNPLFEDLPSAIYLSLKYDRRDLNLLKPYGLQNLSISQLVDIFSFNIG